MCGHSIETLIRVKHVRTQKDIMSQLYLRVYAKHTRIQLIPAQLLHVKKREEVLVERGIIVLMSEHYAK